MRAIKFRLINELNQNIGEYTLLDLLNRSAHIDFDYIKAFPQYTGLKDKNGVEIYEGDIIHEKVTYSWTSKNENEGMPLVRDDYYKVAIKEPLQALFYLIKSNDRLGKEEIVMRDRDVNGIVANCFKSEDIEIIGNIYENPELLEAGK